MSSTSGEGDFFLRYDVKQMKKIAAMTRRYLLCEDSERSQRTFDKLHSYIDSPHGDRFVNQMRAMVGLPVAKP